TVARYLGLAVSTIALTVDPDVFIIGGGVSRAGDYLLDKIRKYYDSFTPISKNRGRVVLASLGNDAGIYGAVKMVL
ncbi:MAG: ROK family protein, partial [Stomatobaculum sp.]|nr:ROK family protein [Stomatobaculum sp.]